MANEASLSISLSYAKGNSSLVSGTSVQSDVAGDKYVTQILEIATTDEAIAKGDMATVGIVRLRNLDATNFVLAGDDGTNYPIKMLAGEHCAFRLNGNTLHLKSDTAACDVEIAMLED